MIEVSCKICDKSPLDITDMINVNDEFYICQDCKDNHWDKVLKLLGL